MQDVVKKNVEDKLLGLLLGVHSEPAELENFRTLLRYRSEFNSFSDTFKCLCNKICCFCSGMEVWIAVV